MPRMAMFLLLGCWVSGVAFAADTSQTTNSSDRLNLDDDSVWFSEPAQPTTQESSTEPVNETVAPQAGEKKLLKRPGTDLEKQLIQKKSDREAGDDGGWWRPILSLAGVLGLIFLLTWGYRAIANAGKKMNLLGKNRKSYLIEVVSRTPISNKQSICLVRMGPRLVMVGVTPDSMTPLHVIEDESAVARMLGDEAAAKSESRTAEFSRCLDEESSVYETIEEDVIDLAQGEPEPEPTKDSVAASLERLRSKLRGV